MVYDSPLPDDTVQIPDRLARLPYLGWGVTLFALKAGIDALLFHLAGESWTPLIYIHPAKAPLFRPESHWGLWFGLWAVAAPFLVVGTRLTLARLRDSNLPVGFVAFFFVPFANLLFFVMMAAVPSRPEAPPVPSRLAGRVKAKTGFWVASAAGMIFFLGCMAISLGLLRAYGIALFVGAPFLAGLASAKALAELTPGRGWGWSLMAAATASLLSMAVMVAFALEGAVCILMASPLVLILALLGAIVGHAAFNRAHPARSFGVYVVLFPILGLVDAGSPGPPTRVVESVVVVDAPPELVWNQVVAFPELPATTEWVFRAGVANPLRAEIEGRGVGAVRRCEFSTGAFVEPITVWDPGRELSFSVARQPDVLRELTLYPGPRPPHLDDYLRCTRGQFLLEALPGGRTRLTGRTWYQLRMGPQAYWGLWSDAFIHRIHMRVLRHVSALSERTHA